MNEMNEMKKKFYSKMSYSSPSQSCPSPRIPAAPRARRIVRQNRGEISSSFDEELQPRRRLFFELDEDTAGDEIKQELWEQEDSVDLVISDEDLELKMEPELLEDEVAMYDKENRYWLNRDCSTFVATGTPSSVPVTECLDHHAFIEMQNGLSKEDYENSWVYDSDFQILVPRELYMRFSPRIAPGAPKKPGRGRLIAENQNSTAQRKLNFDEEDIVEYEDNSDQGLGFLNIFNIRKFF